MRLSSALLVGLGLLVSAGWVYLLATVGLEGILEANARLVEVVS